jgi:RNA polymerase sigma-70 factor (ECF subfamily)
MAPSPSLEPFPSPGAPGDPGVSVVARARPESSVDPDQALVERARTGDAAAFRRLVERHQDRAYAVALRITRSPADAAEAAQEALLRSWLALPGFRGEAAFGTWLHRVVARCALDRAVALEARRAREVEAGRAEEEPAEEPVERDPALARRLERLLARLSPAQRAAVTLYYLEELPVEAIAAALAMPENTVKTHLHRARAALRRGWSEAEEEP